MPLRTLIVDDESIARKVLREELDSLDDVEIVGEAENGAVALEKISEQRPDLVLLDGRAGGGPESQARHAYAGDRHCHRL